MSAVPLAALRDFREAITASHVVTDPVALARVAATTFETTHTVPLILRPGSADEVSRCLVIAARYGIPVHPVSAGRNWGFGSSVPPRDGCAVMDLARMNRVLDFDEDMAWVTVEPGVTFGALYDYLRTRGSRLFASTTGASPAASVLGNALERGDGSGPYGDRWQHVCALEVVLSTGERVCTGFGRYGMDAMTPLHRGGLGPSIDGLFSQSNYGVVTRMTVWLSPLPRSLQVVRFAIADDNQLPALVDTLRTLRLDGTLRSAVGLWNDYRVLSTRQPYPWTPQGGRTPLTATEMDALRPSWGGGRWFGTTALYAPTEAVGKALREHLVSVLAPRVDTWSLDERSGEPRSGHELLVEHDPAFLFLQGVPHEESLRSVYWRKRVSPTTGLDPDRDRCGVLWLALAVPLRGDALARAAALVHPVFLHHGFEPMLAFIAQTDRTAYFVPAIVYDRDIPGEDSKAMALHDELLHRCIAAGFPPYRLGVQSMSKSPGVTDDSTAVLARIRAALDPAGIVSPGRYECSPRALG